MDNGPWSLVLCEAVGQQICDLAITSGVAIPIQRKQEAICNAMATLNVGASFSRLEWIFYNILETSSKETDGWYQFLEAAAKQFTLRALGYNNNNDHDDDGMVVYVLEDWALWYRQNLCCRERVDDIGGAVFYNSLLDTERYIHSIVHSDPVVVDFINSQSQLHVIPE